MLVLSVLALAYFHWTGGFSEWEFFGVVLVSLLLFQSILTSRSEKGVSD